jgi:uncharacterized membrane protein YjgN (DUF898 family)
MSALSLDSLTPVAPPNPPSARISFVRNDGGFFQMLVRGGLLELITAGFYRFWLATNIRRHLWSHTGVGDDVAEYTGTAKELLIGFFFAMAILGPIYVLYFLAGLEAERHLAWASTPLAWFFYLFGQFAIYRARRYRLSRTIWRGLRFWMTGSGWAYAWRAALWGLLVGVTIGIALPWRTAALERYKMRHSHYGDLQASFDGRGGDFFGRAWGLWLATIFTGWLIVPLFFIYPAYKAIEWRWFLANTRFGDIRFSSDLSTGGLMGAYWKLIGCATLLSIGFGAVAFGVLGATGMNPDQLLHEHTLFGVAVFALPYLFFILCLNVFVRYFLVHDLWRRIAETTSVDNLHMVEAVTAKADTVNALGEGLGGSMDIVGF